MMTGDALKDLKTESRFCTCCEKRLRGRFAWLEKDCLVAGRYYANAGEVAPERSQGWFPFGMTCAKKVSHANERR
jgi:hypothetical protein